MDETDTEIVDRVLSGETDAFKHLVWRHQQLLYDLSFRLTGDTAEAEDIAQAAFIKMFSSLSSYKKELAFRNWAYTITLNIARNRLKRRAILRFLPLGIFSPADGKEEERHIQEPMEEEGGRHDAGCAAQDLSNALEKAISALPEELKTAFVMCHIHKNQVKDISGILGITPNAVSIRIYKAREKLMKELASKYQEHFC
ncbi:MAG: hypothetical protein A2270_04840 [Elusimicrobia bacterium RIFOXYA12_FULL_51_18]|nr:MAG: hypothetical protein A2270_04840 [Elusimicrobia bacterium RIFOXYA12_FULL_51_18]OGS33078.1 MAG: hypothetical protein A2218_04490 [Elusimicrobia bacterium RIFOXYA2_FULL_53_38]